MMRLRRASEIATLSLLAWATTASAECAWVLWETQTSSGADKTKPEPVRAYGGKPECDRALTAALDAFTTTPGFTHKDMTDQEVYVRMGNTTRSLGYRCLPVTVDPRGPKGGRRCGERLHLLTRVSAR